MAATGYGMSHKIQNIQINAAAITKQNDTTKPKKTFPKYCKDNKKERFNIKYTDIT
jgi:hypothetical protein